MILDVSVVCLPPLIGLRQEVTWVMVQLRLSFLVTLVLHTFTILETLHQPDLYLLDPTHVV